MIYPNITQAKDILKQPKQTQQVVAMKEYARFIVPVRVTFVKNVKQKTVLK